MTRVSAVVQRRYRAERTVPDGPDGEDFRTQVKTFSNRVRAYRWVARGALFIARRERCHCKRVELEYHGSPAMDGGPGQCRYCDREQWEPLVERLARLLRRADEREAGS